MIPSYLLSGIPGLAYYFYYKTYCRRIPEIFAGEGAFLDFLTKKCPILREEYSPTPLIHESRLMTIFSSFARHRGLAYPFVREVYVCSDGGEVVLDWWDPNLAKRTATPEARSAAAVDESAMSASIVSKTESPVESEDTPIPEVLHADIQSQAVDSSATRGLTGLPESEGVVLILPGLTGSSAENYVRGLVQVAEGLGLTSVVMNYRGISGSLKTPLGYCGADTSDVAAVVRHVKDRYPTLPLIAVGISLGGVLLINYLAQCGRDGVDSRLTAGFAVSAPWNIAASCKVLEEPLNNLLFNRHLAQGLCAVVARHSEMLSLNPGLNMLDLKSVRTIKDFDEKFTAKMFGYSGADEYYQSASLHNKVHEIKTPLLAVNAADDMFSPYEAIPREAAKVNPNVCILITSHGGHIGFLEGWNPFGTNYIERVFTQFVKALLAKQKDGEKDFVIASDVVTSLLDN